MDASPNAPSKSDMDRLTRLVKHGKPVHPTQMGIELDRGEFWGKKADMRKLESLGFVEHKIVMHGPTPVPHYSVTSSGLARLQANAE